MLTEKELKDIRDRTGSPAYVFSGREFAERAEAVRSILGPDVRICYSMKANPFLLAMLPSVFSAVEVCSPGELRICMDMKVPPEMIIYSGLNKGPEDIAAAIDYGVGELTAESRLHLDMISRCASEKGVTVRVLVRASAGSQFGIDRSEIADILDQHKKYQGIEFSGIHFFTGTQKRKAKEIIRELEFLETYIKGLRESSGLALARAEYGTGLPAYMFCDKDIDSPEKAYEAELALLEEAAPYLRRLAGCTDLMIEMGRFFAASCGHYFTGIADMKRNDGIDYLIVDGGSHQIRYFGQMQGMQLPFISYIPSSDCNSDDAQSQEEKKWTIAGSLCTTADVLARNIELGAEPSTGDTLVFHQAGAYSLYECMSLFLSRDMPAVWLLGSDGTLRMARGRTETASFNHPEDLTAWL